MNNFNVSVLSVMVFITFSSIFSTAHNFNAVTPCEDNEDCEHLIDAKCEENICMCNGSRICDKNVITSMVVTKIGENCSDDSDCNIDNAKCKNFKCVCKANYVKSTDEKRCLIVSEGLGGSCEDSVQCYTRTANSGCQRNKCVCEQHMHEYNGSCYRNVELGQNCESSHECSITEFSECINSKCSCVEKYVDSSRGSRCLLIADSVRSRCVDNSQCTRGLGGGSECKEGFCECKELYQFKESTGKCVRDKLLGETCEKHSDCHGPYKGPSRSECVLGVCKCKSFYIEEDGFCRSSSENLKSTLITVVLLSVCVIFKILS